MKIYRFIPNGRDFASIDRTNLAQWWPDGIELGRGMSLRYPKHWPSKDQSWPHEGNVYVHSPEELALPDFPAFALNLPVVSARAADVLTGAGLIAAPVPMTVSGARYFAVQPLLARQHPGLPEAFVAAASRGLSMPRGEVYLYHARVFDPARITGEFFTIPQFEPFSELYVTERLVELARSQGLTGLEYVELVFDDGPIIPCYPPTPPTSTFRADLELELIRGRCDLMSYSSAEIDAAFEAAVSAGYLARDFVAPEHRRSAPPGLDDDRLG